jgi:stress response protein SCP2
MIRSNQQGSTNGVSLVKGQKISLDKPGGERLTRVRMGLELGHQIQKKGFFGGRRARTRR